ncbi:hypothetical protein [Tsukamurella pseudospumae]|uniref:Uncharacterized protein n=1 Tax=Tsukamurella pseudospumae TaxID=239498 RepID=A0A137ZRQ4_9ACTN|nr:hypothetical protein [Tsukamurella pseudospumae]KXP00860.1 hypothetical protein AXK61_12690 [Tsukamurella pseudospumae]
MIAPKFVAALPESLFVPDFLDYAAGLAEQPGVWAEWPGDEVDGVHVARPGDFDVVDLHGEGPGGAVEWTRRAGLLFVRWVAA